MLKSSANALAQSAEGFVAQGNWPAASEAYRRLSCLLPSESDVYYLHGRVLMELGQLDAALAQFGRALAIRPHEACYHKSIGDAFLAKGAFLEAEEAYRHALSLVPEDCDALINLGNAMNKQGRPKAALACYDHALTLDSSNLQALNNIGKTWHDQGDLKEAKTWYEKALSHNPEYPEARFNRAVILLTEGDYRNGWREYEWRFKRQSAHQVYPHRLNAPRWNGMPFGDKRLLVHCEQGMGDVIQFSRYLPMVKSLGGSVTLEAHAPLVSLFQAMPSVDRVVAFNRVKPPADDFDFYVPLMSLPLLFRTTIDNIPAMMPYLQHSKSEVSHWHDRKMDYHGSRVGIVWSGSTVDPRRTCPWGFIEELVTSTKDVQFVSLQKELPPDVTLAKLNEAHIIHWGDLLKDFQETAAAMSCLDLVISIDTAAAHLAGAIAKPLWLLLPHTSDWRWLQNRQESPWYPTARLYRQPENGNWSTVLPLLIKDLATFVKSTHIKYYEHILNFYKGNSDVC